MDCTFNGWNFISKCMAWLEINAFFLPKWLEKSYFCSFGWNFKFISVDIILECKLTRFPLKTPWSCLGSPGNEFLAGYVEGAHNRSVPGVPESLEQPCSGESFYFSLLCHIAKSFSHLSAVISLLLLSYLGLWSRRAFSPNRYTELLQGTE